MSQNIINIEGTNLPDVWYQTLYKAIEVGRDFKIDRGSNAEQWRKEFDFIVIRSKCPGVGELLPKLNPALQLDDPCAQDYLDDYLPYLMTGEEKEGEAYTYGQRMCKAILTPVPIWNSEYGEKIFIQDREVYSNPSILINGKLEENGLYDLFLNQMELMIWTYKNKGYRNNQMVLQVGQPSDMILKDPPCLRHIDTRIQNNPEREKIKLWVLFKKYFGIDAPVLMSNDELKTAIKVDTQGLIFNEEKQAKIIKQIKKCEVYELHFYPYFRSWDLWGGFPANLAAIELMKQYCAAQIGVENGEIIASSKGLHLYNYVWKIAETVRGRTAEEFKAEMIANPPNDYPNSGDLINSLTAHGIGTFPKDK